MSRKCLFSILLFICTCFLTIVQLSAQEEGEIIIISERVGKEIDQEERDKFELFQSINGFQSAVYIKLPGNKYILEITYLDETTRELKIARIQQSEISIKNRGNYIDRFEELQGKKHQKVISDTSKGSDLKEKDFYITPRIGLSTFTGNIGIELQYKHFAFDIGDFFGEYIKHYLTTGFKYYINSYQNSLYVGIGGGTALVEKQGESNAVTSHLGLIIGYCWRWRTGFEFNLGIGPLFPLNEGEEGPPMMDLVLGYSF